MFAKHTKRQSDAQDTPTDDTWGIMVTKIQLKLSRSRGVLKHTKTQSDAQDAPTDITRGVMVTKIQLKLSSKNIACPNKRWSDKR